MENGLFLQRNCVYAARVGRGLTAVFFTFPALLHHYYTTVFVFCKSCLPMQEQSSISGSQSRPCVAIVIHMKYLLQKFVYAPHWLCDKNMFQCLKPVPRMDQGPICYQRDVSPSGDGLFFLTNIGQE